MRIVLILSGLLIWFGGNAEAKPPYLNELMRLFPENRIANTTRCMTCHDGSRVNRFGQDYSQLYVRSQDREHDLPRLRELDSDGDGRSNEEEIRNGTNPGRRD